MKPTSVLGSYCFTYVWPVHRCKSGECSLCRKLFKLLCVYMLESVSDILCVCMQRQSDDLCVECDEWPAYSWIATHLQGHENCSVCLSFTVG